MILYAQQELKRGFKGIKTLACSMKIKHKFEEMHLIPVGYDARWGLQFGFLYIEVRNCCLKPGIRLLRINLGYGVIACSSTSVKTLRALPEYDSQRGLYSVFSSFEFIILVTICSTLHTYRVITKHLLFATQVLGATCWTINKNKKHIRTPLIER